MHQSMTKYSVGYYVVNIQCSTDTCLALNCSMYNFYKLRLGEFGEVRAHLKTLFSLLILYFIRQDMKDKFLFTMCTQGTGKEENQLR